MNLPQRNERPEFPAISRAQLAQKFRTIAFDRGTRIIFGESQIEGFPAVGFGKSTGARAEAVDEPGNAREWGSR